MVVTTLPFVVSLSNHPQRYAGLRPFDRFRPFDRLRANGGVGFGAKNLRFLVSTLLFSVTTLPMMV
jgi:hypothetical protein